MCHLLNKMKLKNVNIQTTSVFETYRSKTQSRANTSTHIHGAAPCRDTTDYDCKKNMYV